MGCCFAPSDKSPPGSPDPAHEAKKDLADPPIPVFFILSSKQHQLHVRKHDPTREWKFRLLQFYVDAQQVDARYLPEELHLEFCGCVVRTSQSLTLWQPSPCLSPDAVADKVPPHLYPDFWCDCSASIAHTQCLHEHGVEPDALVDVQLAVDVFAERLREEERKRKPKIAQIAGMSGWFLDQVKLQTSDGQTKTWGNPGGGQKPTTTLESDEYVISIGYNDYGEYIGKGIEFRTNKGRTIPICGSKCDAMTQVINAQANHHITVPHQLVPGDSDFRFGNRNQFHFVQAPFN